MGRKSREKNIKRQDAVTESSCRSSKQPNSSPKKKLSKADSIKRQEVTTTQSADIVNLPLSKLFFFGAITIICFFLVFEGLLSFAGYKPFIASDPYVGFKSKLPLFVIDKDEAGNQIYRTAENKLNLFNMQSFPSKKSKNTFRVFTLGGSTTYGRPYFDGASFTGWFREFVRAADTKLNWEIINCGGVSYASYRVAALMEELLQYEPDLFIVYSGHNEFLERRTYSGIIEEPAAITNIKLFFGNLRLYSFINNIKEDFLSARKSERIYELKGEVDALLDNSAGPEIYSRDDELQKQILAHYRFNLSRMVELAKSRDIKIIFVTPPVSEKDFSPFKSEHASGIDGDDYEKKLIEASSYIDKEEWAGAADILRKLLEIDNRYALTHYELGRVLFGTGRFEEAKKEFIKAIDEDICPLRKLSMMDKIIKEVASNNGVPLVDFTKTLESLSLREHGHAIPGKEYFLDHVHPAIAVNRLLGLELLKTAVNMGIVNLNPTWGEAKIREITEKVEGSIDEKAHAHANKILARVLIWAGKRKEAALFAKSSAELLNEDAEAQFHMAFSLEEEGKYNAAIEGYKRAIELNQNYIIAYNDLGLLLNKRGMTSEALNVLEEAIKKFPDNSQIYNTYGQVLYSEKHFEEAIRSFQKSLELESNNAGVHSNLGLAYSVSSQPFKALESFKASLKLDPDNIETKKYMGLVLAMVGKHEEALSHFENILEVDPSNTTVIKYVERLKEDISQRKQ